MPRNGHAARRANEYANRQSNFTLKVLWPMREQTPAAEAQALSVCAVARRSGPRTSRFSGTAAGPRTARLSADAAGTALAGRPHSRGKPSPGGRGPPCGRWRSPRCGSRAPHCDPGEERRPGQGSQPLHSQPVREDPRHGRDGQCRSPRRRQRRPRRDRGRRTRRHDARRAQRASVGPLPLFSRFTGTFRCFSIHAVRLSRMRAAARSLETNTAMSSA